MATKTLIKVRKHNEKMTKDWKRISKKEYLGDPVLLAYKNENSEVEVFVSSTVWHDADKPWMVTVRFSKDFPYDAQRKYTLENDEYYKIFKYKNNAINYLKGYIKTRPMWWI